jgi:O-antigen ligase
VSIVAIVCRATAPDLVYALFKPEVPTSPFGHFLNRNHMGSWLVLALPLVLGYLVAHIASHSAHGASRAQLADATTLWLGGAACAMYAAAILTLSRSTFIGIVAVAVSGAVIAATRTGRRRTVPWLLGLVVLSITIAVAMPRTTELVMRFENSRTSAAWSRQQIWHDTWPIVRDFPLTGVGVGAYPVAMLVYQQSDRRLFFNQAHDQYLQLASEGGVLLLVPLTIAAIAFGTRVAKCLRDDHSSMFWIRSGAVAGIAGIFVQSFWETGLRMPANALLFAALCAAAIHKPHH